MLEMWLQTEGPPHEGAVQSLILYCAVLPGVVSQPHTAFDYEPASVAVLVVVSVVVVVVVVVPAPASVAVLVVVVDELPSVAVLVVVVSPPPVVPPQAASEATNARLAVARAIV